MSSPGVDFRTHDGPCVLLCIIAKMNNMMLLMHAQLMC